MYYLAEKYLFSTIPELIHYHQHNAAGKRAGFPRAAVLEGSKQCNKLDDKMFHEFNLNSVACYMFDRPDNTFEAPGLSSCRLLTGYN